MSVRPGRCLKVELIQASPPRAAALRELKEEMGTDNVEVLAESREWVCYDLPEHLVGKAWTGRWCGQRQKWFAMRFMGSDLGALAYASSGKHQRFYSNDARVGKPARVLSRMLENDESVTLPSRLMTPTEQRSKQNRGGRKAQVSE